MSSMERVRVEVEVLGGFPEGAAVTFLDQRGCRIDGTVVGRGQTAEAAFLEVRTGKGTARVAVWQRPRIVP